jgi:hypothetical protein
MSLEIGLYDACYVDSMQKLQYGMPRVTLGVFVFGSATMLWFSEVWMNYWEECQRSWMETARQWGALAGWPTAEGDGQRAVFFRTDFFSSAAPSALAWWPRVEAQIEPLTVEGATEAARLSMRVFMPWGGPFWVEALIGRQEDGSRVLPPQAHLSLRDKP